jgi:hemerythrin-like domain-containing protein
LSGLINKRKQASAFTNLYHHPFVKVYYQPKLGLHMTDQIDLYTGIHKGQRYYLSQLSKQAGTLNVDDSEALSELLSKTLEVKEEFRVHAALEEHHIHPLLYDRIPEGARELEADHRRQEQKLDDLGKYLERLLTKPLEFEKLRELALEFYRGLNRFIAIYLVHINKEEENILPTLWRLCTGEELANAFSSIVSSMKPEELMLNLSIMIPAMNVHERVMLLSDIKATAPPEAFKGVTALAEGVLSPDDWEELQRLGNL